MQIKSWQIALVGLLPLIVGNILFIYSLVSTGPCRNINCAIILFPLIVIVLLDFFAIVTILFLRSENKKHMGAVFSIVSSVLIGYIAYVYLNLTYTVDMLRTSSIIIIALWPILFLLAAGINYFWKKV